MAQINTKYIDWDNVPEEVRTDLVVEADLVSQDDCDSRIVLYEHTINHIIVANQGLGTNPDEDDREHPLALVNFAQSIFEHDIDWYIVE